MRIEQVEALMEQVGPILDPLHLSYHAAEKIWGIQLDPETLLLADLDETNGKLFLSSNLGTPPQGDRSKLYEMLLLYNDQWHVTGGGRLSLDAPAGNIIFIYELSLSGLDLVRLVDSMRAFGEVAQHWKQIIASPLDQAQKTDLPMDSMMIRI